MPGTNTVELEIANEVLQLSALRAVFWPRQRMLIIADLHLGKTGHFRTHGIPVSNNVLEDDLKRLSVLVEQFDPQNILVVGDLFHHKFNNDLLQFARWKEQYGELGFLLVPGNHDKHLKMPYSNFGVEVLGDIYIRDGVVFVHEANEKHKDIFSISGHLHPGYRISGRGRQSMVLPCFAIHAQSIILPAFSLFTGLYTGYATPDNANYFVINGGKIYKF